jgi:hypothetical protein
MATLGTNVLTLSDWAKRIDPTGKISIIVEMLSQVNEFLTDQLWIESNLPTGHRVTVRTGLPNVFWRLLNQGTQPSKSTTAQIDEDTGILEAWSEVDKDLAELNGNVGAFRLSEAQSFLEAMSQEMAATMIYGNSDADPEEFNGLDVRFNDLSAPNGQNIIDAGGVGSDNSSIWLLHWGINQVCGIFPKGTQAGLIHTDLGMETVETTAGIAGNRMLAYRDRFQWKAGMAVKDWRFIARVANIDISNLVAKVSAADLFDNMIKATHVIPNPSMGRPAFYMNRTVFQMLDIQGRDDMVGSALQYVEVAGRRIPMFRGIPVRIVDALTETEAQIT